VTSLMQDDGPWPSPTACVPAVTSGMQADSPALPVAHCGGAWREKRAHKSSQLSIVQCCSFRIIAGLVIHTLLVMHVCEVVMSNALLLKHAKCFRMLSHRLFWDEVLCSWLTNLDEN
jgi:hypothetical protein